MGKKKFWLLALKSCRTIPEAIRMFLFARFRHGTPAATPTEFGFRFHDRDLLVSLRRGTTDIGTFIEVFRDEIYALPRLDAPGVILDIGGNIGMASLYLAVLHPGARIHVFEPVPANLEILRRNVGRNRLANVTVHPYGLGARDEVLRFSTPNPGEFWAYGPVREGDKHVIEVPIRAIDRVWDELGLETVSLAKIDCEGAEVDLLRSLGPRTVRIESLVGEFHEASCNANEALYLLSLTHDVDHARRFGDLAYPFRAVRKIVAKL